MKFFPGNIKNAKGLRALLKPSNMGQVFLFCAVTGALIWLLYYSSTRMGYNWQWYRVPRYLFTIRDGVFTAGPLLQGLKITLAITGVSLVLAFVFALTAALMRMSNSFMAVLISRAYIEAIRNTPLLIQIFFIYFVLAPIFDINRFTAAVLALSLFEGAYGSEVIRAGIVSIHKGQWEAGRSLGLTGYQLYRYIILPQGIRRVLPPLTSQGISLVKDSALVSTIAVYDLTMRGLAIIADTFLTFEVWFTVAGIYLFLTVTMSLLVDLLSKKLAGRRVHA